MFTHLTSDDNCQLHSVLNFHLHSKKSLGGGTILDLGVYTIQISQFVFGAEPVSIKARGQLNDEGVDLATEVEMTYPCGGVAKFKTSALKELGNRAIIRGSEGEITVSLI